MSTVLLRRIFLLVCAGCIGSAALAADVFWAPSDPNVAQEWGIASNWDLGVPTSADNATIQVNGAAVVVPAGESYQTATWHVANYANNTLYVAPGASLSGLSGRSYVAREGGQSIGVLTIDGSVSAAQIAVTGGAGANATIIVNETGTLTTSLILFGSWGGGQHGSLIVNGGLVNGGQFGAYGSLCNVTVDLNDGVYNSGYLNPAVLGLYDSTSGSLLVDIDHGTWVINDNRTTDVATMLGRGEIVGFGGAGTISYDYNVTTAGKTTVTATHPLNLAPEYKGVVQVSEGAVLEWDNYLEPSEVGGTVTADVWFGTLEAGATEPNKLGPNYNKIVDGQTVTPGTRSATASQTIVEGTTYYWQVDLDNGSGSLAEGPVYIFTAVNNEQPVVSVKNAVAWLDGGQAVVLMDATVVDDTPGITYTWTLEPVGDPDVIFDSTSIEDPTLTISSAGERTLTLTVEDGFWTESVQATVNIATDACEAARLVPGYSGDLAGDISGNCVVDIEDLAALVQTWLDDTRLNGNLYF